MAQGDEVANSVTNIIINDTKIGKWVVLLDTTVNSRYIEVQGTCIFLRYNRIFVISDFDITGVDCTVVRFVSKISSQWKVADNGRNVTLCMQSNELSVIEKR